MPIQDDMQRWPYSPPLGPINRLLGIVPTFAAWGVNPPNPALATDNNWANSMGNGVTITGGAVVYGRVNFDMGAIYNIELRGKVSIGNNNPGGGNMSIFIHYSEDGITWFDWIGGTNMATFNTWLGNATVVGFIGPFFGRARYIQIDWYTAIAATNTGDIYEMQAIDLGP